MKFIALTYNYNLEKLSEIGRKWANNVYKNNDFIFDYSAASYASFIHKNPNQKLHIYTDNVKLMSEKMSKYNINLENIIYIDYSEKLNSYPSNLEYCFTILHDFIDFAKSNDEYTIKLDNDLIFHNQIPVINEDSILVWKYERIVKDGDVRWGEIKVCDNTVHTINFPIYNIGILGFPPSFQRKEVSDVLNEMIKIDISDVTDVGSKIYHCCEQTANNFIFHKYNYNITECYEFVTHFFDDKKKCIDESKFLLKNENN